MNVFVVRNANISVLVFAEDEEMAERTVRIRHKGERDLEIVKIEKPDTLVIPISQRLAYDLIYTQ